jgi:hypothetical protein
MRYGEASSKGPLYDAMISLVTLPTAVSPPVERSLLLRFALPRDDADWGPARRRISEGDAAAKTRRGESDAQMLNLPRITGLREERQPTSSTGGSRDWNELDAAIKTVAQDATNSAPADRCAVV